MKIVIVGAGKVGYSLAQRLIQDDHDVYVIDRSPERIHNLENTLDVSLVQGNGSDVQLLNEIGMSDVGMFIAVTDSDEVNMLSCAVAKITGVPTTIARVRDNSVAEHMDAEMRAKLGVDLFINPEMVTAQELLKILETPSAIDVEEFGQGVGANGFDDGRDAQGTFPLRWLVLKMGLGPGGKTRSQNAINSRRR